MQGSATLTPWLGQFVQLLELSFPGATVVLRHAALVRPQVHARFAGPEFAAKVAQAAAHFGDQLQKTQPDELRRLNQLLSLGRENTQSLCLNDSLRIAHQQVCRPSHAGHTQEIFCENT